MTATAPMTWLPLYIVLFYIVIKNNDNMAQIGLVVGGSLVCLLFADGLADGIVKPWVARPRPSHEPALMMVVDLVNNHRDTPYGFFSAHAANTMSITVFMSLMVRNPWLTTTLVSWSLLNCWTRLYLGLHYPSDILIGLLWGATVGCGVYWTYLWCCRQISLKTTFISKRYTSSGYSLTDVAVTILTFLFCGRLVC